MTKKIDKAPGDPARAKKGTVKRKTRSSQSPRRTRPRQVKKLESAIRIDCPSCGASIPESSRVCPSCKADLSVSESVDEKASKSTKVTKEFEHPTILQEDKKIFCRNCTWLLDGTESNCPNCGMPTGKVSEEPEKEIHEEPAPAVPEESVTAEKPAAEPEAEEILETRACPVCGTVSPVSIPKCLFCNTSFEKESPAVEVPAPAPEVAAPEPEAPEVSPPENTAPAPAIEKAEATKPSKERKLKSTAVAQTTKPVKARRLKSAKTTIVPTTMQPSTRGLTNGVGQAGMRGATNGGSFVNGTGMSNGLGSRPIPSSAKRMSFLTNWKFLAVLVAIIIIIPAFMVLSYSNNKDRISIDGDFSDWNGATLYGMMIHSTAPSSNITEWAIKAQSSGLFLYLKTQGRMMDSPDAESYYLFVDSDGSNATGYIMESIGADYMLQITGWNSAINITSLSSYSSSDHYNWDAWTTIGSLSFSSDLVRLEAQAALPVVLGQSAKFVLVSKDSAERGSVSYTAPMKGGVLIVSQAPSADVEADGIVPKLASAQMLTLRFSCDGEGGQVSQINPSLVGAQPGQQTQAFSLKKGEQKEVTISVDTSASADGHFASAEVIASSIVSTFASVQIIGSGASAYVGSRPSGVSIDGAFADWTGRLSMDQDANHVANPNVDINETGNYTTSQSSSFYVSVKGDICSGTFVPAAVSKPSSAHGGGPVTPTRHTGEDILNIYIDSDESNSTGDAVAYGSILIGADQKIEVKGLFGRITSTKIFNYLSSSHSWIETAFEVDAAKDDKRIEIGISAASLGGSVSIDFIVETTSWKGRGDLAIYDPSSIRASTRSWIVNPLTDSPYATSMSYQRKLFYDGINLWSFFFDGTNTVYKYSTDGGETWTVSGQVFRTPGVNETSVWYDNLTKSVYAVGDIPLATHNITIQKGSVNALAHTISWAASDSSLNTTSIAMAGKNTYISKDTKGYLWVLSSNCTQDKPGRYWLDAFRSRNVNSTISWVDTGQMLPWYVTTDNAKGSIVPAGSGGDVWAVYIYGGYVSARKYNGTWQADQRIYTIFGSTANTDNSPPSVVVDKKGVVHVVYGTGRRLTGNSIPFVMYSHNNTGLTTFTAGVNLDPLIPAGIGDYYPTISLDTSTGNLYALWLRGNATFSPQTVMGSLCVSGVWSSLSLGPQTSYAKQFLTSIYSAPGEYKICWQWTQNTTSPADVLYDRIQIPEFGSLALPFAVFIGMLAVFIRSSRRKGGATS